MFRLSLKDHPGWLVFRVYVGLPALAELMRGQDFILRRLVLGTAVMALVMLVPILWTAWASRHQYEERLCADELMGKSA